MVGSVLRVRYELTQLVQDGSIFTTYSARDRLQPRELSVRLIKPTFAEDPAFVSKLKEVVERYASVHHPGLESLIEVDIQETRLFELPATEVETRRSGRRAQRDAGHRLVGHQGTMQGSYLLLDRQLLSDGPTSRLGARCPRGCLARTTLRG